MSALDKGDHAVATAAAFESGLAKDLYTKENAAIFKAVGQDGQAHVLPVQDGATQRDVQVFTSRGRFKDDPNLSPAQRAFAAVDDFGHSKTKTITSEQRSAFEGALTQADQEAQTGGSPRLPGMKEKLAQLQSELNAPDYKGKMDELELDLKASINKLSPADKSKLDMMFALRPIDPQRTDQEINKLVPSSDPNQSFTQKVEQLADLQSKPKQVEHQKLWVELEAQQQLTARVFYSAALSGEGKPEDNAKAKQMMQQVMDMDPTVYKKDPLARKLMDQYGIFPGNKL